MIIILSALSESVKAFTRSSESVEFRRAVSHYDALQTELNVPDLSSTLHDPARRRRNRARPGNR
jgi:hypothetical protein